MPAYTAKNDFRHDETARLGVLLTNLGTPDAPTTQALRRYLGEFLADPRVIEAPRWLWRLILHGIILRTRPRRSAAAYARIWGDEGSPLLAVSRRQLAGLRERLESALPGPVVVELGMRYGRPAIRKGLRSLRAAGARRILILPLYPQYSGATVGSTFDAVAGELSRWRWVPELRMVSGYHDDPGYLDALAQSIRDHWQSNEPGQRIVFSFHGLPERYLHDGDPYHCQCHKTARLVAERLGLSEERWMVTFQSRFGPAQWLQPYTDDTLEALPGQGITTVDVVCPGFSADCLETLDEIANDNDELFRSAGGQRLGFIPCLNDRADHLDALRDIALKHLHGWPEAQLDYDADSARREAAAARRRALALGAAR